MFYCIWTRACVIIPNVARLVLLKRLGYILFRIEVHCKGTGRRGGMQFSINSSEIYTENFTWDINGFNIVTFLSSYYRFYWLFPGERKLSMQRFNANCSFLNCVFNLYFLQANPDWIADYSYIMNSKVWKRHIVLLFLKLSHILMLQLRLWCMLYCSMYCNVLVTLQDITRNKRQYLSKI